MIPFRDNIPSRYFPFVTVLIIAANCLAFLWELSLGPQVEQVIVRYALVPARFGADMSPGGIPADLTGLITSMFLHGGWAHLIGNMWFLWIFGDNVEDLMGHGRFLLFYLCCGIGGSLLHIFFNPGSRIPSIGASGAVAGVLGAYVVSYPFARILTLLPLFFFWPVIELPAILVLGGWFLIQLLSGAASLDPLVRRSMDLVAWWAHVGGFVAGILLLGLLKRRARTAMSL